MGISPGRPSQVYVIPADGGTPQPVYQEPQHNQEHPSWSPDGKSLLFSYIHRLEKEPTGINIVHLASHKLERMPGSEGLWEGDWSPDGRYVVARTFDSHVLMLFDFHTGRWEELVTADVGASEEWSSNGRFVHFNRIAKTQAAFGRVNVDTRWKMWWISKISRTPDGAAGCGLA